MDAYDPAAGFYKEGKPNEGTKFRFTHIRQSLKNAVLQPESLTHSIRKLYICQRRAAKKKKKPL